MNVNHAVLAVEYGLQERIPYWILKNSWGGDWRDSGFFKIIRG
jgi:cathepsin H